MKILNVLYQSSNLYAPITGVSMTSLMENNKDIDEINLYLLNDEIDEDNLGKFREVCEKYGRNLTVIETAPIISRLKDELKVTPYRGSSYTPYLKVFALKNLSIQTDRILYLDSDTIVNGSLAPLLEMDFNGNVMAMSYCLYQQYKELINIPEDGKYYNIGATLFNYPVWVGDKCEDQIIRHIHDVRSNYFAAEQDIVNVVFRNKIMYLDLTYNFLSNFYIYGIKESYYVRGISPEYYENHRKVEDVYKDPVVHHLVGTLHGRPWEGQNNHPLNDLFDKYLKISPWNDYTKMIIKPKFTVKVQRILYKVLPRRIYVRFEKFAVNLYFKKYEQKMQTNN